MKNDQGNEGKLPAAVRAALRRLSPAKPADPKEAGANAGNTVEMKVAPPQDGKPAGRTRAAGIRRARPVVVLFVVLALLMGVTLARAAMDGFSDSASTVADSPSPSASQSPTQMGVTVPEGAGGGGSVNNEVVILNSTDTRFASRARVGLARVTGGEVNNTNSAAAASRCTDCRTVAVAVQAVLVMGDSDNVSPKNQAVAINYRCLRCETIALAYQNVFTTGGIVHFTAGGQQQLAVLESEIRELTGSRLDPFELEAQIDAVVEKIWGVVKGEAVKVGLNAQGKASKKKDVAKDDGSPTPAPSASPGESATPPRESPGQEVSPGSGAGSSPSVSPSESSASSSSIGG